MFNSFIFGPLSSSDNNSQTLETYKCRLSKWFIANAIDQKTDPVGTKKRAIHLRSLCGGTHKLTADFALTKLLHKVPYAATAFSRLWTVTLLRSGFGERYKFYSPTQQPREIYTQWTARLRMTNLYLSRPSSSHKTHRSRSTQQSYHPVSSGQAENYVPPPPAVDRRYFRAYYISDEAQSTFN